jgi:high-affinity iron transporter
VTTNILLLIGAGLFSHAVSAFRQYRFKQLVGADDLAGVYYVRGSLWQLNCCNPEEGASSGGNGGWLVFSGIFGWNNGGSSTSLSSYLIRSSFSLLFPFFFGWVVASVLAYVFYWLAATLVLVYMKYNEV